MKTVYKYELGRVQDRKIIEMPKGAEIIHAGMQGEDVCLWAFVDTEAEIEERKFRIYGTGHPIADRLATNHVATFFDGQFVWHLFGEVERKENVQSRSSSE